MSANDVFADGIEVDLDIPEKLIPVFLGEADIRGAWGGRGSAKTRTFAMMAAVFARSRAQAGRQGIILCGRQYMNSLDDSSMEEVKAAIREKPWLEAAFDIGEKYIRTKDGNVAFVFAGLQRSIASVKGKSRILLCWVDEAEPVPESAWQTLIPTLREEDSELWVTWNPERKFAAVEARFRNSKDPRVKVVSMNWRDNPRFPRKLERDRQRDLLERPESYDHIWEGAYKTAIAGSYYNKHLTAARAAGRFGRVAADPLMRHRAFLDIGGTGRQADAFSMWISQFIGREIRVLDYYEAIGQELAVHLAWLQRKKLPPGTLDIWLPHDGATHDKVYAVSYESALIAAGYNAEIVPNQGQGAAIARIEAGRRVMPSVWWNEETTGPGVEALAFYHEKRDELRDIGLGPDHDWSSHAADAYGLMAIVAEASMRPAGVPSRPKRRGSAMAA